MKILLANKYFFLKGGAENSFFEMAGLLEKKGHKVIFFSMKHPRNLPGAFEDDFVSNVDYDKPGARGSLKAAGRLLYSFEARRKIEALIRREKPDLAHLNNIYHQISPSILHSLKKMGVPAVMTLRDYKVVCASYSMVADNKICEACKGGAYYQCFLKKCVKESAAKSLLSTVEMYLHHNILNLYGMVHTYISPSRFLVDKVHDMGFPGRVEHIPNFTSLTQQEASYGSTEKRALYFGRLSKEKGLLTLVDAASRVKIPGFSLDILGEGPIKEELDAKIRTMGLTNIRLLGYKKPAELAQDIRVASILVLPSEWYENNPRMIIEGFALGKPAVGARIGGIPELVRDGETGYTYTSGDAADFAEKMTSLLSDPDGIVRMGKNARRLIETELSAERHYEKLIKVYEGALR